MSEGAILIDYINNGSVEAAKIHLRNPAVNPAAYNNLAIRTACKLGNIELIRILIQDARVNPAVDNNSLLIDAVRGRKIEVCKILLSTSKVDPSVSNNEALSIATLKCDLDMIRLLLNQERVSASLDVDAFLYNAIRGCTHNRAMSMFLTEEFAPTYLKANYSEDQLLRLLRQAIVYNNEYITSWAEVRVLDERPVKKITKSEFLQVLEKNHSKGILIAYEDSQKTVSLDVYVTVDEFVYKYEKISKFTSLSICLYYRSDARTSMSVLRNLIKVDIQEGLGETKACEDIINL